MTTGRPDATRTDDVGPLRLDTRLLDGFTFGCRPDCGLCCYAEPRVETAEIEGLLEIVPEAEIRRVGREAFVASRPDGGACQFLVGNRCRVHARRPHPCREYPLTVHLGRRLQASVVLSCPGVDPAALLGRAGGTRTPAPRGLESELAAVEERLGPATRRRLDATRRRGEKGERLLSAQGRGEDDAEVRRRLRGQLQGPDPGDFPTEDPPDREDGLERLPLFWDGRTGPVGLARGLGGWEALEFAPEGGTRSLGVFPPPERPPTVDPAALGLLTAYLAYWLERDAFLAAVHVGMLDSDEGSVSGWAAEELRVISAETLSRASVRAKLRSGPVEVLTADHVRDGIRAVDQDWLDRPTWGERL